ncbi:hypothetical protein L3X38_010032 [Prunus dulcis]|uniref:Crossover junction endonuclease MUS81 n=1 Tax=Prunus dulcis TaxID=3755 RepID=A0AAD4ZCX5_PRUDU|nr:hypothetical protein L3X38_010032 [Prunus dulcis]
MYLVEGDPNTSEAAESMETTCFTTEMLEAFDVQRTIGLTDTLKTEKMVNKLYTLLQSCMQVPQLTEEVAIAVMDLYLTLLSLARTYSLLEGDVCAQEEMLRTQSNNAVNEGASKNIFHLVWGN